MTKNKFYFVLMFLMLAAFNAYAQDANPASIYDKVSLLLDKVSAFMDSAKGGVMTGFLFLFAIAKRFSNERANKVVMVIQKGFDGAAKVVASFGALLKRISDLLAEALKSDGFLGKP